MIMDDSITYLLTNLDFNNQSQIQLDFTSRRLGDVSPIVGIISGIDTNCALSSLYLSKGVFVPTANELREIQATAYTVHNGRFLFKVQSDTIRPNITPESPQAENELYLVCRN
jgi:hypothetical protein